MKIDIRKIITTVTIVLGTVMSGIANAKQILIQDQHGQPLANAVLEFQTSDQTSLDMDKIYIVDQINKMFVPHVRVIPQGALVEFPNSDNIRHNVYSFSETRPFQLKLYAGKPEKPIQFPNEGIVVLGCNVHDSMVGYIYVATTRYVYKSDSEGVIELNNLPDNITQINLWHPYASQGVNLRKPIAIDALEKQEVTLSIEITEPRSRNTFEDVFRKQ